ncbi:hypothetical protein SAMN04487974_13018 [Pelagibacterium luteolum]|uniref:Uncharacterized protein n=1 Tax=Pelagibacterium luteolum TaxID=440168 RepID=A0A1G8AHF6_9HYPH|nr:hypothetical protein SAMN04487974_13018 [Pelagibacterium luteolum]
MHKKALVDERIRKALMLLRGWEWMCTISCRHQEAIAILTEEALSLLRLGKEHPSRAREIGAMIVQYERLITSLKATTRAALD